MAQDSAESCGRDTPLSVCRTNRVDKILPTSPRVSSRGTQEFLPTLCDKWNLEHDRIPVCSDSGLIAEQILILSSRGDNFLAC
jgi:hypothetical protein